VNQNTNIQVLIYNIQGRVITTLIDGFQTAGYHSVIWDASKFSSGIYFLNMSTGEIAETKKMILIK
jgi:flagellar hook assembly protein FlgD